MAENQSQLPLQRSIAMGLGLVRTQAVGGPRHRRGGGDHHILLRPRPDPPGPATLYKRNSRLQMRL